MAPEEIPVRAVGGGASPHILTRACRAGCWVCGKFSVTVHERDDRELNPFDAHWCREVNLGVLTPGLLIGLVWVAVAS